MAQVSRWVVNAAVAGSVAVPVVACQSNGAAPPDASSSGGVVNTSSGAGGSPGGAAGTSLAGTGGAGTGSLSDCRELGSLGATRNLYAFPAGASFQSLDRDGDGLLISLDLNKLLRVVALEPDGNTSQLLAETEYTRLWSFDPVRAIAARTSRGLDVLVSDDADLDLIRKDGTGVALFKLAWTNNMDLEAQALGTVGGKQMAGFSRGSKSDTLAMVDLDAVTAGKTQSADLSGAVSQWVKTSGSTRDFAPPAGFNAAPSPTGLWLTAERLDPAKECTVASDALAGSYDCNWHIDAWHFAGAPSLASPTTTVDARTRITSPTGGDVTTIGLNHADRAFSRGGLMRNHAIAVDPATSRLAMAIEENLGGRSWDIRVLLLDPSGEKVLDVTVPSDTPWDWKSWWLFTRNNRIWLCHGTNCAVVDTAGTLAFTTLDPPFTVKAVMAQPDGLMLVGVEPDTAIVGAVLPCRHH